MLRKSVLFFVAAVLLSGCDFFSTREFRSKPSEIRSLSGLSAPGDSVSYRVTESLWDAAADTRTKILSRRRLVFTFLGDSLDGIDTLKILSLRIRDDSAGTLLENSVRLVRFTREGVLLNTVEAGGGARFFPLKASASAAADSSAYLALPALLVQGWNDTRSLGVLTVRREQVTVDTLSYQGHLEESWGIKETVLDGNAVLSEGLFLYGVSGLLKADQTWGGFDWRDANGSSPAKVELRRSLERL